MALYGSKKTISIFNIIINYLQNIFFFFFFSFLICLCSFRIKNKLESHKKICENKDFSSVEMPSEDTKILEFNQYQKFDEAPFIIYANLE